MQAQVRYYSKLGNTKKIAEAMAEAIGTRAVSIEEEPELSAYCDLLFLGGAPYANIMAPELKAYAARLTQEKVGRVVLFTTSNWSRRTVRALRKQLREQHIPVENRYFYAHMLRIEARKEAARAFARAQTGA